MQVLVRDAVQLTQPEQASPSVDQICSAVQCQDTPAEAVQLSKHHGLPTQAVMDV